MSQTRRQVGTYSQSVGVFNVRRKKVRELENIIQSEEEYVEITFNETVTVHDKAFTIFGYPINSTNSNKTVKGVKLYRGDIAVMGAKTIVVAGTKVRLFIPKLMREDSSFREDYLCITQMEKKRKPNKRKTYSWE